MCTFYQPISNGQTSAHGDRFTTRAKDENNNAVVGNDVLLYDTTNCIINMPAGKLVVLQGLDDYIIVEDSNALASFAGNSG